ncbi:MAG: L-serine ammonia-lyase, iron-sulfur-dependent, subunit alpha [Bacillota bacterium]|nr:L-serine ammonia-lyase, iron-sulfur-dependent, subunit alpha [Bacillota bacterium]
MNHQQYIDVLEEELVPALGCTEPIAIAYAAALARETLKAFPERLLVECSNNIIKNVKSVVVPNTQGQRGIAVSAVAGVVSNGARYGMEVLSKLTDEDVRRIQDLVAEEVAQVEALTTTKPLHIKITAYHGSDRALVEITDYHTNVVRVERNDEILVKKEENKEAYLGALKDRSFLTVNGIYEFATTVDLDLVRPLIRRQMKMNMAIAREGLSGTYGLRIGSTLLKFGEDHVFQVIKAYTAAASEARMSGCTLPVVTNSGSGNQGISSSVPVIVYAREKYLPEDTVIRALLLSNLLTIHQKTLIGRLSAFCGVVSACTSSGAAITYLAGGTLDQIKMTITDTLANIIGIVCDGAKASCAIKIAAGLDAAMMAHLLAMENKVYQAGDGIVKADVEDTIRSVGKMARDGMKATDDQILKIMLDCD